MDDRHSLRRRILHWLGIYAVLLMLAVFVQGFALNESAERLVWQSLLDAEMDNYLQRRAEDPAYRWRDTGHIHLYAPDSDAPTPEPLLQLPAGLHDEIDVDGRLVASLIRDVDGTRYALTLGIDEFEQQERRLTGLIVITTLLLVLVLAALVAWGLRRMLRPLSDLASDIATLKPDRHGQRIEVAPTAGSELHVIAGALNDYLRRHELFVERERVFIDTASHELRTPIAVIAGATELALEQPDLSAATRARIQRADRTARDVEQLISLLLVLAKEPEKLSRNNDRLALDELIPDIVDDHRYLARDKDLDIVAEPLPHCEIVAPLAVVQAAIGNLLRNAIEKSDQGTIHVRLSTDATVTIEDPGHGMTPEQISRIYAQVARGGGRDGGGIGLDLISRLCEHLGWRLNIESAPGHGTISTLRFPQ
ncbi:two-component sensor histidine kinase [Pseudoxanthomonas kalamensis DSM 18571]|uniref:sensor histidine kinase n=1 Tax=Pseudoxanthomonas kalamensis TaxID=289483 RepID=UPI001391A5FA|nr:HAMP domain-containing sensor histidine kinase [Pseudoxanthomonas kalamensis]KAF1709247.1 two-component sensor histidine kinase [Pseudoxanthomonas kalamensis DSM 18571]